MSIGAIWVVINILLHPLNLIPKCMCGRCLTITPPRSTAVQFISPIVPSLWDHQSLPLSLSLSLSLSLYLTNYIFLGLSSSYIALQLLSLHIKCPRHVNLLFRAFVEISPDFRCPTLLSCNVLSSFGTPHIHLGILISSTSNFVSCAFFNDNVSAPYACAGFTTFLYMLIFKLIILDRNNLDTLYQFFHTLCTLWLISASIYQSSANVDPIYFYVFTILAISPCKCISTYWCPSQHKYSVFF